MMVPDAQLIAEAVLINHAQAERRTVSKYETHLHHLSSYLESAYGLTFYTAQRKHINLFMAHLAECGGTKPHASRLSCEWCAVRGYPDGRSGLGWSASTRKSYLSAIKFLYDHFACEEDLPSINPAASIKSPKVVVQRQYTPSREEVQKVLDAPGRPRDRLIAHWTFYAPSRRETFVNARWRDIDLDAGRWDLVGKGRKSDCFDLHPLLVRELRRYRKWQSEVYAVRHAAVKNALGDPESAFVLLTCNGKPVKAQTITAQLKWRAVRAGVAVVPGNGRDCPGGKTSRISAHAMRRAWADLALNEENVPIDVVAEVLHHADISTTRNHYARTKPERARDALKAMRL